VGVLDFLPICCGLIWIKPGMKCFSDFSISIWKGSFRMVRVSGLKAAKGFLKAG
jgi:hypothetical protein